MKITVFGATGGTGKHVVRQALEKGHQITAYTRSPGKPNAQDPNLTVFEGDILDAPKVTAAIQGADAVISTLGPTDNTADFVVTRGTQNIINAMHQHGVKRLLVTAGAGVQDPKDEPKFFNKMMNRILKAVSKNVYEDMVRTVESVRASDLDWTIVRAPMLTDDPPTGSPKATWVGKGLGLRLSRTDLAAFLVEQVDEDTYLQQAPALSSE